MHMAYRFKTEKLATEEAFAARLQLFFECLMVLSVVLFVAAFLFTFYNWQIRAVQELSSAPGVKMWSKPGTTSHRRHEVFMIEFRDTQVTPGLLDAARTLPHCYRVTFNGCRIDPEASEVLAECPALEQAYFISCQMDVGRFVSECAESPSLQLVVLQDIETHPGDFREMWAWEHLEYLSLKQTDIVGEDLRHIARARNIETIDLSETTITDEEIAAIVESDTFEKVRLTQTDLAESQLAALCRCENLEVITIAETPIALSALETLQLSKSLRIVNASDTPLGQGFEKRYLANGCVVYGSGNR